MALPGGHVGQAGIWSPTQAEAVVITSTGESYAILETVEMLKQRMSGLSVQPGDSIFVEVSPKEGGTALLNVKHIVGFVSQGEERVAG